MSAGRCIVLLCALWGALAWSPAAAESVATVGWVERVTVGADAIPVTAKLDTGADMSSLHAANVQTFKRDNRSWVAFEVSGLNGQKAHFERRVLRTITIKRARGVEERRPAVMLGICLGDTYRVAEVNLVDRSGLSQPLLIGRNFLGGRFAVDAGRTFTVEPQCERDRKP